VPDLDRSLLPLIGTRAEALAAGLTADQVRHKVRGGHWRVLHAGVYWRGSPLQSEAGGFAQGLVEHALRCAAAVRRHPAAIVSQASAAVVHGPPLVSGPPEHVQLLVPAGAWRGIRHGVHYGQGRVPNVDVHPGLVRVTTVARTWVDVARQCSMPDALSVGDRAVREGRLTRAELLDVLSRLGQVRGRRKARSALDHLDGKRESPLESWSWARFLEWQVPLPAMQREFFDEDGFIGRTDFWWEGGRVVGEADGRVKYDSRDSLYAEKRREDRLRALGLTVVRWGWNDLARGADADRLRRRLASALRAT
jgi:hypothetical protein